MSPQEKAQCGKVEARLTKEAIDNGEGQIIEAADKARLKLERLERKERRLRRKCAL